MNAALPNFIGIGALKSGTTWLANSLSAHPEIFIPPSKETHFFDYPYNELPFSHYENIFRGAGAHKARGEFSSDYLACADAPARILRHLPDVRLIVSFRNPAKAVYSNYWHLLRQNFQGRDLTQPSFFEALERYPDMMLTPSFQGRHFARWLELFSLDRFCILWHEEIMLTPEETLKEVFRFLDVDDSPVINAGTAGADARVSSSPRGKLSGKLYSHIYQWLICHVMRRISLKFGYDASFRLIRHLRLRQIAQRLFFKPETPRLSRNQEQRVVDIFADDIALLSELTGRNLDIWLKPR